MGFFTSQKKKDRLLHEQLESSWGNFDKIKRYINDGANVHLSFKVGYFKTPMLAAIHYRHQAEALELVELLISKGANPSDCNESGIQPMHTAAVHGKMNIMSFLAGKGISYGVQNSKGETPLFFALKNQEWDTIKFLADKPNAMDVTVNKDYTHSILTLAVSKEAPLDVIQLILQTDVDVNFENDDGEIALIELIKKKQTDIVNELLNHKDIDLHVVKKDGETVMHAAAYAGDLDLVKFLLDKGVSIEKADSQGLLPLDVAISHGRLDVATLLVNKMQENDIAMDVDHFMLQAVYYSMNALIPVLASLGADANWQDDEGKNLSMIAAERGAQKTLRQLFELGADPYAVDYNGEALTDYAQTREVLHVIQEYRLREQKSKSAPVAATAKAEAIDGNCKMISKHSLEIDEGRGLTITFNFAMQQVFYRDSAPGSQVQIRDFDKIPRQSVLQEAWQKLTDIGGEPPEYKMRQERSVVLRPVVSAGTGNNR